LPDGQSRAAPVAAKALNDMADNEDWLDGKTTKLEAKD